MVFAVHGTSDEHLAALLDVAELDRQVDLLEAELRRGRRRELVVGGISALGWILLVITNWRSLCWFGAAAATWVGRTIGGLV